MKNHYHTLNIKRTASSNEVKEAYRKLSKKLHPDINGGDKYFEEFFKEVKEAYETLSDTQKRQAYNWDLDHSGKTAQTPDTSEQEEKLQAWFDELSKRQQAAFQQRVEEIKQAFLKEEARFAEKEKQSQYRTQQAQKELRNVWVGAIIIVLLMLFFMGIAAIGSNQARREAIEYRTKKINSIISVSPHEWGLIEHNRVEKEFWRDLATHYQPFEENGISKQKIVEIKFQRNSNLLSLDDEWLLDLAIDYIKSKQNIAAVHLITYSNTIEPTDDNAMHSATQDLSAQRAQRVQERMRRKMLNTHNLVVENNIELFPTEGDSSFYQNRGRAVIIIDN